MKRNKIKLLSFVYKATNEYHIKVGDELYIKKVTVINSLLVVFSCIFSESQKKRSVRIM